MAVFLINTCKFKGCGANFVTLSELIQHIEDIHIDKDPGLLEKQESQQPACLALSYVLRVYASCTGLKKCSVRAVAQEGPVAKKPRTSSVSSSNRSSEFDDDEAMSDNEDDESWMQKDDVSTQLIINMLRTRQPGDDRPFACPIPGCRKKYKNINGIKYHAKHGHITGGEKPRKPFVCKCGKSYKTAQGLKNHSLAQHGQDGSNHNQNLTSMASPSQISHINVTSALAQKLLQNSGAVVAPVTLALAQPSNGTKNTHLLGHVAVSPTQGTGVIALQTGLQRGGGRATSIVPPIISSAQLAAIAKQSRIRAQSVKNDVTMTSSQTPSPPVNDSATTMETTQTDGGEITVSQSEELYSLETPLTQ